MSDQVVIQLGNELDAAASLMGHLGYRVIGCDGHASLRHRLSEHPRSVVVVDLDAATGAPEALREIVSQYLDAYVVGIAQDAGFPSRIEAVRSGCAAFLAKPLSWFDLIEVLDRNVEDRRSHNPVVLIFDDDEIFTTIAKKWLALEKIDVVSVFRASETLDALISHQPDLLIVDLNIGDASGFEVAAVVRQMPRYVGLPIVFLSGDTGGDVHDLARQIGADDFLSKPITPKRLAIEVRLRVQRGRAITRLMDRDGLTGMLNQRRLRSAIEREMRRARRQPHPVSLAIIDVDFFKAVNDTHGHVSGDRVLVMLAKVMRARLRLTDVIGRMGGEEFAVIMPDTTAAVANQVIDELRQNFGNVAHYSADGATQFKVSFSAGVSEFRESDDITTFIARSDDLLYRAKQSCRNRVVASDSRPAEAPAPIQDEAKRMLAIGMDGTR
ncbi:MAG: diguanylate cyclase [Acidimicrobiia bacterium]